MSTKVNSEVVVASGNTNKIRELQTVADEYGLRLLAPREAAALRHLGEPPEVDETSETYRGNALLKAVAFAQWSGLPALGDDSGLEVSALGNRPGVHSARYGAADFTDRDRYMKLITELNETLAELDSEDRSARFRCFLVLALPDGSTVESEGILEGEVLTAPLGENGFGYDPVIRIHDLGKTLAEVEFATVCETGFRARAARKLFAKLEIG